MQPGKYTASILDYGVIETKSGNLQALILLGYSDPEGTHHEITWFGSFKEGQARQITMETLVKCGLRGNDVSLLGEGVTSGLLDVETPVYIAVIDHEYEGKKNLRVQWIARKGGGVMDKRLGTVDAKSKLSILNLKGAVMAARMETGIKDEPRKAREPGDDFNDIFDAPPTAS